MYNYNNPFPYPTPFSNSIEIPHVNGQNGAIAYQMPSNSSVLLLDDNAPIVYLVKTDSACYKTITPYTISEYKPKPPIDMESLLNRIEALERRANDESNIKSVKNSADSTRTNARTDEYSQMREQSN